MSIIVDSSCRGYWCYCRSAPVSVFIHAWNFSSCLKHSWMVDGWLPCFVAVLNCPNKYSILHPNCHFSSTAGNYFIMAGFSTQSEGFYSHLPYSSIDSCMLCNIHWGVLVPVTISAHCAPSDRGFVEVKVNGFRYRTLTDGVDMKSKLVFQQNCS